MDRDEGGILYIQTTIRVQVLPTMVSSNAVRLQYFATDDHTIRIQVPPTDCWLQGAVRLYVFSQIVIPSVSEYLCS
jgi:hypothetical protein